MKFYVNRVLHNGAKDATDYAKPSEKATLSEAKKEAHNILATYINYGDLDKVSVLVFDDNNTIYMSEVWNREIPIVTETVSDTEEVTEEA